MKKLALIVAFAGSIAGCNQQAVTDLAACKGDLGKAQAEITAAKAAATAAEQKATALEAQVKQATDQLAAMQKAADEAAQAAAKATAKVAPKKPAVVQKTGTPVPTKATGEQKRKARF